MSNIYHQEPPTSGKVVLNTSHGDIEIEIWAKETPKTSRNFLQLCLEGYYDNTIFHRLLPNFMIQGGDPTGSGMGGESIYGKHFEDEFHQKLRFTHRGIVAMANEDKANTNGSQFFITFDKCEWLNKKHTIFGKVVGDTMFNLLEMQKADTDCNDRPVNPPSIINTKIIINPFDDLYVRDLAKNKKENKKKEEIKEKPVATKKPLLAKRKQNSNLLSFAEDEEVDYQEEEKTEKIKIKSSHDMLEDSRLSKEAALSLEKIEEKKNKKRQDSERQVNFKEKIQKLKEMEADQINNNKPKNFEDTKRSLLKKRRLLAKEAREDPKFAEFLASRNEENRDLLEGMRAVRNKKTGRIEIVWENSEEENASENGSSAEVSYQSTDSDDYVNEQEKNLRKKQKEEYDKLKIDILRFKREKLGTRNETIIERDKQETKLLSMLELKRMKFVQNKKIKLHENEVIKKLNEFKEKLNSSQVIQDEENWMNNKLKFHIDSARAYSHFNNKEKAEEKPRNMDDDYEVLDTRKNRDNDRGKKEFTLKDVVDIKKLISEVTKD